MAKPPKRSPLAWLLEPIEEQPTYFRKKMFGCEAAYLDGRLVAVLADGKEPWNGILLPTERECQASLVAERPALSPHPILGKWLYLSQNHADFEAVAGWIIERVKRRDPRFGVEPKPRKTRRRRPSSRPTRP